MNQAIRWMVRQGDVALIAVDVIPANATRQPRDDSGRVVLAYGEATGHAHALHEPGVTVLHATSRNVFLQIEEPANLIHEEHDPIAVPPGLYRVVRQREWSDEDDPVRAAD